MECVVKNAGRPAVVTAALVLLTSCGEDPTDVSTVRPGLASAPAGVTVTAATPDMGIQGTTLDVTVSGTGFDRGSVVDFARDGVVDPRLHVNSTTYRTTTELRANVTIAADAVPARYDVAVTTSKGKKGIGTERFAVAVPYELLDMAGSFTSGVTAVSATGWISGVLDFHGACSPYLQPVVWSPAGTVHRFPLPPGRCAGRTRGVDRNGVVVGTAYTTPSDRVSVRWTPQGGAYTALELPILPNGYEPGARSITTAGVIGANEDVAVWTEGAGWRVSRTPAGYLHCGATGMNEAGQLAASCMDASLNYRGFVWASPAADPVALPLPPGTISAQVLALSGTGSLVGHAQATSSGLWLPVRWLPAGAGWTVEMLPHLGQGGAALGLNDAGFVVGRVGNKNGTSRPVMWTPGGTLRLLGTGSRGEGAAYGISDGSSGLLIGGNIVTGKSVGDILAVRWRP